MPKTLLELVNNVGRKLRRSDGTTYLTANQDANSIFIVEALNEAQRMVEAEPRDWNILQRQVEFNSQIGVRDYDLSDESIVGVGNAVGQRAKIIESGKGGCQFWDITDSEFRLNRWSREQVRHRRFINPDNPSTRNGSFALYPTDNGQMIEFPYLPEEVRNYLFVIVDYSLDMEEDTDTIRIYETPVIMAATALAAEERGEELGLIASTWWERYNSALSEAIILDSDMTDYVLCPD